MNETERDAWNFDDAAAYADTILTGRHCRLRGLRNGDLEALVAFRQSASSDIFQSDAVNPTSEATIRDILVDHLSNTGHRRGFCVESLPDGDEPATLLGIVTLSGISSQHRSAMFAISLDRSQGGHGYGRDATEVMIRYGFRELGLHRIELGVWAYNTRAQAVYRKSGFIEEGRRREAVFHDGRWHDEVLMSVLASDAPSLDSARGHAAYRGR